MPNLIYYKDNSGVVSGPLKEEEASALYKGNFFRPDHVFRIVDAEHSEEFTSIDDLRSLNGAETPFRNVDLKKKEESEDSRELVRVYKELANVLHDRCKERAAVEQERAAAKESADKCAALKMRIIDNFKHAMKEPHVFLVKLSYKERTVVQNVCGRSVAGTVRDKKCRFTNNSSISVRCLIGDTWRPAQTKVVQSKRSVDFDVDKSYIYIAPHFSDDPLDGSEHMPNLIYYKDTSGVVSGPLKEEEATALYKGNFFRPDHVFSIIDASNAETFTSIDDLRALNGAETPFGQNGEEKEQKELVRVYKELEQSLKTRLSLEHRVKRLEEELKKFANFDDQLNELKMAANKFDTWEKWEKIKNDGYFKITRTPDSGPYVAKFENRSPIDVWVMYTQSWTPSKFRRAEAGETMNIYGTGSKSRNRLYIAPYLSDYRRDHEPFVMHDEEFTEKYWHSFTF